MLTLNTAFLAELSRSACRPVVYGNITLATGLPTLGFSSDPLYYETPTGHLRNRAVLSGITPLAESLDPLTRDFQIGSMTLDFIDEGTGGRLRQEIFNHSLKGHKIEVYLRTDTAVTGILLWVGQVDDISFEPGKIVLRCVTPGMTLDQDIELFWVGKHPAELIAEALAACGVPSSQYDAASLAYDADETISHWCVRRQTCHLRGQDHRATDISSTGDSTTAYVTIADWTQAVAGDTITMWGITCVVHASSSVFPNFRAQTSNSVTATNLAACLLAGGVYAASAAAVVTAMSEDGQTLLPATSSRVAFASIATPEIASFWTDIVLNGVDRESSSHTNILYPDWTDYSAGAIDLYSAAAAGVVVASATGVTPSATADQVISFSEEDNSGISGSMTLKAGGAPVARRSDFSIYCDCSDYGGPVKGSDLIREMCLILNAALLYKSGTSTCKYYLKRYTPATAIVDSWTTQDMFDLRAAELPGEIINDAFVSWLVNIYGNPGANAAAALVEYGKSYEAEDTASQDEHSFDGGTTDRIYEHVVESDWISACGALYTSLSLSSASVSIGYTSGGTYGTYQRNWGLAGTGGLSGTGAAPTQDTNRKTAATRIAYLLIGTEIIKVAGASTVNSYAELAVHDADGDSHDTTDLVYITYTTCSRGQLGTSAALHAGGDLVYDVTIPVEICTRLLARWAWGMPILECETSMAKLPVELGDFIGITHALYCGYQRDGAAAEDKWEVISKEVDPLGSPPRIKWRLARTDWAPA